MPHEAFPEAAWRFDAVEHAYEPGSTMKIFVAAGALEEGLVTPDELIFCENGSIEVARGHRVRDHKPFGTLSVTEVIAKSSNVGAIKIARRFPSRRSLHDHLASFGFGRSTGLGLPGESAGILREPRRWSALSASALAIGQEMSVSPLQLARAAAVLANSGYSVQPYAVSAILGHGDGKEVWSHAPPEPERVAGARAVEQTVRMMEEVVLEGTGQKAGVPGYRAAGKTGTAQKLDPATGTYAEGRYVALFTGFLPVEKPELVLAVVVNEPRKGELYYGGDVAAPVFGAIARQWMLHAGVPPSTGERVLTVVRRSGGAASDAAVMETASSESDFSSDTDMERR
jgi:cell division protein FtsI (penicillin-binding protein 3)